MRIRFAKKDSARFISHLDLVRTAGRSLKRAGIPVYYTQGFNPHPYLVFSPPLPVGVTGLCELLDIRLDRPLSPQSVLDMLKGAFPAGLEVQRVYEEVRSFNEIAYARYQMYFPSEYTEKFSEFIAQDHICVEKRAKKGRFVQIDLKQEFEIETAGDGEVTFVLPCGNEKNIGVALFSEAFRGYVCVPELPIGLFRIDFLDSAKKIFE